MTEHKERREFNIEMATALGRIEQKIDSLADPDVGRVAMLEKAQERAWWMTYVGTPALVVVHALARRLGVHV